MDMDDHEKDFIAVIVDFDGPEGVVVVDNVWLLPGEDEGVHGKRLYITSNADVFLGLEQPDVYYIRQG